MSKRKERVAPPPLPGGWDCRFATSEAAKGWDEICAGTPNNARTCWDRLTADPRQHEARQHRLKGTLGTRVINGTPMEQWQYEVTAGGRVWYCIDDDTKIVWLTDASVAHPKSTE